MIPLTAAAICALTAVMPAVATADPVAVSASREDAWEFGAFLYGWFPNIGGQATFPNSQTADITVDASDLIKNLKMGALLSFEARKGVWGLYTDAVYMDVGSYQQGVHNFKIGGLGLPADVSSSTNFDLKSTIWTLAGTYRLLASQEAAFDVLAGARLLDLKEALDWTLVGNVGPIVGSGRAGSLEIKDHVIDGVIGFKGRAAFGQDRAWFIPYYADIGTGNSNLTWQAMAGVGYAFTWGEIMGGYRYMDYQFKSDSKVDSLSFDGPLFGVALRW
jgi:hypothetical protein